MPPKKSSEKRPVPPPPGASKRPGRPSSRQKGEAIQAEESEGDKEEGPENVLAYVGKLDTKRMGDNELLRKALRRSTSPVRTKMPPGYKPPPGGKEATILLQCCARMMIARRSVRRRRAIHATQERRRQSLGSPREKNEVFRQMDIHKRVAPLKFIEDAQAAALSLQAWIRAHRSRSDYGLRSVASAVAWRHMVAARAHIPWRRVYAVSLLEGHVRRALLRMQLGALRAGVCTLQAHARRRTYHEVRHLRRLWVRRRFEDAFKTHKLDMIRQIKIRKTACVPLQAALRRSYLSKEYSVIVQETRDEEDRTARRLAAAIFLSTQTRMSIYRTSMQRDAEANNLLRRFERARAHRERYVDVVSAASELRRHFKAVSAQLRGSNRLLIPLTRHTQAHREAKRCASVLQSVVRVWLLNYHGQSSSVEMYGDRRFVIGEAREEPEEPEDPDAGKVGRIHLNMDQKRWAAITLQRGARMALAFTGETSVKPSGHSAVLVAAARLHATVRGQAIRDMVLRLSEQYGAVVFQAQARMRFQNIRHTRVVAAYVRATAACKRALVNQWHVKTFAAQIRLQAVAKMRATPDPGLYYCRLPTRKLASIMQARARMAFLSREHAEMRLAALTMGAIVKARMYRMRYLSTKTWCAKAGGNQHDLHKIFGKLTNTMDKNGTPFWRKKDFVTRRDRRSMTYGGGGTMESMGTGTVTGLAMTEKKRGKLNEERRKQRLKGQGESEGRAAESGLRLTVMHMPLGTGRILAEGRLAKVLSESMVVLDELGTSTVKDCYRHFSLKNGKQARRIIKYTHDRICTVVPPFDRRPVQDSQYTIIDLEVAPFEPNLVLLRRQREFEAARCIQNRYRYRLSYREYLVRLNRHRSHLSALQAEGEYQQMLAEDRERARLETEAENRARRAAIEEGKRLVALEQARQEARIAAMKEAKRKQMERLWGLKPNLPVAPARPFSPSPRAGQHLNNASGCSVIAPPPRPKPPSLEELEESAALDLQSSVSSMPPCRDMERFLGRPDAVLPAIYRNTTVSIVMRSKETSPDRPRSQRLPNVHGSTSRPATGGSDRDAGGRHAFAASPIHVRKAARVSVEGALVDRSPPKMDRGTLAELEGLKALRDDGGIGAALYKQKTREVRARWREGVRSPASPGKTTRWDSSTRVSDDLSTWDVGMVELGWGTGVSRHNTPMRTGEGY